MGFYNYRSSKLYAIKAAPTLVVFKQNSVCIYSLLWKIFTWYILRKRLSRRIIICQILMCLGIFSTSFGVLFKWKTSIVILEICIITLATSVSCEVCSTMRCINVPEAGRTAYMMNEKNKSLGKPGVKTEGTKKIPCRGVKRENGVCFIFLFHFLVSWQISRSTCKGLEWKYAWKMENSMKKYKFLVSSIQFFYSILLSSLTPCYFPPISQPSYE